MPQYSSPLRYPGGKGALSCFLGVVLRINGLEDGVYIEPYAGGAGAALNLLFREHVSRVILNDADPCIFAFWNTVLNRTRSIVKLIKETPVTIEEWKHQKSIYCNYKRHSMLRTGFACFFLNRCNRSGIIVNGGPIGGIKQTSKWKLGARFNKEDLVKRIERIGLYRDRIDFYNMDAIDFIERVVKKCIALDKILVYLDPPYFKKGSQLYLNHYGNEDHEELAVFLKKQGAFRWLMSYDNVPEIHRLYSDRERIEFNLPYSANVRRMGQELLIQGGGLKLPRHIIPLKQVG